MDSNELLRASSIFATGTYHACKPIVVTAPGTIPVGETICFAVSPFAAEIFGSLLCKGFGT